MNRTPALTLKPVAACGPAVARLIQVAKTRGSADVYAERRRTKRVAEGIPLEVTFDPLNESASFAVTMRDISEGGVSFWSTGEMDLGVKLHVREFSPGKSPSWIPVRVKHCTMAVRGYLVGAAFEATGMAGVACAPPQISRGSAAPSQVLRSGWCERRPYVPVAQRQPH
jgi:hypothetical protein